jgi:hypothetical protein
MIIVNCSGSHCDGCGHGTGPRTGAAVVLVVLTVIVARAHTIERGIGEVARVLIPAALALAALIVAGTASVLVIRRHARARHIEALSQRPAVVTTAHVISRAALPAAPDDRPAGPEPARAAMPRRDGAPIR